MGITEKILLVLFAVFALLAVLRLFAAPLKLAGKLLVNTLLGFALLGILSALGVLAKLSLGLNLFNALGHRRPRRAGPRAADLAEAGVYLMYIEQKPRRGFVPIGTKRF